MVLTLTIVVCWDVTTLVWWKRTDVLEQPDTFVITSLTIVLPASSSYDGDRKVALEISIHFYQTTRLYISDDSGTNILKFSRGVKALLRTQRCLWAHG